ncbi:regulatory protein ToxS [Vibrio salinus]|uniref:regulatory protein ToxS n=1 Tax=Vibrio salinus TaxID=2899784 RepID=UPI001E3238EE|nr:regulatory protein ToxS [Vibrio salinus]MCE0492992.1 regulatory protein ToxS [Vibrio salinus]
MNKKVAVILLLLSVGLSLWIYLGSNVKLKQLVMSREWQSRMITIIKTKDEELSVNSLKKVVITSNVKYLPNSNYIRVSVIKLFSAENGKEPESTINISETGTWSMSENYLLISPNQFKDISSKQSKDFSPEQLDIVTQFFKMDAQQSRRVDIVNDHTLLFTGLNHDSTLLYSD